MVSVEYNSRFDESLPKVVCDFGNRYCYYHCHRPANVLIPELAKFSLMQLKELYNKLSVCIDCLSEKTYIAGTVKLHAERRYILANDIFLRKLVFEHAKKLINQKAKL